MKDRSRKVTIVALLLIAVGAVFAMRERPAAAPETGRGLSSASVLRAPVLSGRPRLVDLGAQQCIPCKMMAPVLEDLRREYAGSMDVVFIDVWKDPGAGEAHQVDIIPTQIFFDASGRELYRHQGFIGKADILSKWKALGYEFKALRVQPAD